MILPLLVAVLLVGTHAETAADFAKRVISLGETFASQAEVQKLSKCMEDPLYKQESTNDLLADAIKCAQQSVNNLKFVTGMGYLTGFNQCIQPTGETWQTLLDKVYNQSMPVVGPLLDQCNGSLTSWKQSGVAKAQCISKGYKMLLNDVAKANIINTICQKLVKLNVVNKVQWNCALQYAPKVLDISKYSCAKMSPTV